MQHIARSRLLSTGGRQAGWQEGRLALAGWWADLRGPLGQRMINASRDSFIYSLSVPTSTSLSSPPAPPRICRPFRRFYMPVVSIAFVQRKRNPRWLFDVMAILCESYTANRRDGTSIRQCGLSPTYLINLVKHCMNTDTRIRILFHHLTFAKAGSRIKMNG